MLKREVESINRMIYSQYERLRREDKKAREAANAKLAADFLTDPKIIARMDALATELNLTRTHISQQILGPAYGGFVGSDMPLRQSLELTGWVKNVPESLDWNASPLHGAVEVALATSTKKWGAIQPAIYGFADTCTTVKTIEDLEKAVKVLLTALA